MSERPQLLYSQDILDAGAAIQSYVQGITFAEFVRDRMRYSAVIREFEIIGEAVGKLSATLKDRYPDIPWQDIKDFRNLLAHEYFGVDLEIVWNTIHNDLPMLLEAVQKIAKGIK
ncbi:HepT-like ribonuclease domain-containing protein [Geomobilimonas luticola]|uniref:DUF86 domain-containing protein n=1 Tax=Geomobilimonas luticola TaxID=1114878 RepID=A0ABS5S8I0_9BACT|nr:DUF86 domain-containing protein [Geomobilimonas luticola]MBT0651686.1 DUF86 domain-containing protein [Geomobilimonas luticola]